MITVLVVDDHPLVRRALHYLLDAAEDIHVVGEAENGLQAIRAVQELAPDVVLMDVAMPVMDGLTAIEKLTALKEPPVRVLIHSIAAPADLVCKAFSKGAMGFLVKQTSPRELVPAVVAASQGQRFLSAGLSFDGLPLAPGRAR